MGLGGFAGCGGIGGFGFWVFLSLGFLDVDDNPLWVSRVRVSSILINIWRFLSGWRFLDFNLVFLGF